MNEQYINSLIDKRVKELLQAYTNFTVPQHRHNGSDSLRIVMGDLMLDPRGLNFPSTLGDTKFSSTPLGFGISTNTNNADFIIGDNTSGHSTVYKDIALNANSSVGSTVFSVLPATGASEFTEEADNFEWLLVSSALAVTLKADLDITGLTFATSDSTNPFTINIPDTTLAVPVVGAFTFSGGSFQGVTTAAWEYIPTSTGATGGGVIPAGTVEMIINGTTYNVLVT